MFTLELIGVTLVIMIILTIVQTIADKVVPK